MTLPLPTFLIIGAQKSGTRWLRQNLGLHPQIFCAEREIEYFNHHFDEGEDWYRQQFKGWNGEPVVGEATPGYMFYRENTPLLAGRIAQQLGTGVKLMAILRHPVSRTRSAYIHQMRRGRIRPEIDPLDYLSSLDAEADPLGLVSGGWYGSSLSPFRELFGDGLQVEWYDDVKRAPREVYARALRHLGLSPDWWPQGLDDKLFSGVEPLSDQFPGHPILSLSDQALSDCIGHHFRADIERLGELLQREIPWTL